MYTHQDNPLARVKGFAGMAGEQTLLIMGLSYKRQDTRYRLVRRRFGESIGKHYYHHDTYFIYLMAIKVQCSAASYLRQRIFMLCDSDRCYYTSVYIQAQKSP
jgi:hypothetical protein